jgi:hypothetical protein
MAHANFITPLPMRWNLTPSSSGTGRFPANLVSRPTGCRRPVMLTTHFSAFLRCVTMYPDRLSMWPRVSLGISAPLLPGNAGGSKVDPPAKLRSTCSEGARRAPLRAVNRPSSCCLLTPDSCLSRMTAAGHEATFTDVSRVFVLSVRTREDDQAAGGQLRTIRCPLCLLQRRH